MSNLKNKVVSGIAWSSIDSIGLNIFRFVFSIFLARLLDPEAFGLIAMISIFISISDTIVDGGFTQALIRKVHVNNKDYLSVFLGNLLFASIIYVIIFFVAPYYANYFEQPLLKKLTRAIAFVVIIRSFGIVQFIYFKRALDYKNIAKINITSTILGGIIGIIMAYTGFGVWSLVFQVLSKSFITTILLWLNRIDKKIKIQFDYRLFVENFNFGYKIMLTSIMKNVSQDFYNIIIAKFYSATTLGYYYQGRKTSTIAHQLISKVFNSISFPTLSSLQDDKEKFHTVYIKFLRSVLFFSFPLMMLLIIIADPLIVLIYTQKWQASVPLFQLFCISGILMPIIVITRNMPLIAGKPGVYLRIETVFKIAMIIALIITAKFGVQIIIIGYITIIFIQFIVQLKLVDYYFNIKFKTQLYSMIDIITVSGVVSIFTYFIKDFFVSKTVVLIIQTITFIGLYILANYLINSKELAEIQTVGKKYILKIFSRKKFD